MQGGSAVPPKEIEMAPRLCVSVLQGGSLQKGTTYLINACGYARSRRRTHDGCVYAGTKDTNPETGQTVNDIVLPPMERGMGQRHFVIKYVSENKSYYLRDMGEGTGTFIKIDKSLVLRPGYIISYGDAHMAVNIQADNSVQLKYLDGPKTDETL